MGLLQVSVFVVPAGPFSKLKGNPVRICLGQNTWPFDKLFEAESDETLITHTQKDLTFWR